MGKYTDKGTDTIHQKKEHLHNTLTTFDPVKFSKFHRVVLIALV